MSHILHRMLSKTYPTAAGGEGMAGLIATGRAPDLIAPFTLERFARDHALADAGSAGTR